MSYIINMCTNIVIGLSDDTCHSHYHNLDKCIQSFPGGGINSALDINNYCEVNGGYILKDDFTSSRTGMIFIGVKMLKFLDYIK